MLNFKNAMRGLALAFASMTLVACASAPAPYHGFGDPMAGTMISKNPYVDGGQLTTTDYEVANTLVNKCNQDFKQQTTGSLETMGTAGAAAAASGAVGGLGSKFIKGAVVSQYVPFYAAANGAAGINQGAQIYSTGKVGTVSACASIHSQHPNVRRIANGVAIVPSYGSRTKNTSKGAPAWVRPASSTSQQRSYGSLPAPEAVPNGPEGIDDDPFINPGGPN